MGRRLATPRTALVLALLTLAPTIAAIVLTVLDRSFERRRHLALPHPVLRLVGVVVARRQPRNAIGWSLLG